MPLLVAHQCVQNVVEQFVGDPYADQPSREMQIGLLVRGITELVVAVIVANMAAACHKGGVAVLMWILAFLFWPLFFVYYVMSGSKCAAYWVG